MGTTTKRKARALAPDECDASLVALAHALDNLTRAGALLASGASERYPPCALALHGDDADDGSELHFPVGAHDAEKIKARGARVAADAATQLPAKGKKPSATGDVWEVAGACLTQRNPRWEAFLTECFEKTRATLGIAATAKIDLSLRKLMLVEAGAALQVRHPGESLRDGVFGALVVTLPGGFKGGELAVDAQQASGDKHSLWRPGTRKTPYDLTFAAVYDQSGCVVKPVTSGTATFLVYDLKTTTPNDVPRYGGSAALQQGVHSALDEYFAATPAPPEPKRLRTDPVTLCRVPDDSPPPPRHFAYLVGSGTFEKLNEHEKKVAEQLIAFCAQSNGEYVLYLTGVLCSRESERFKGYGHHDLLTQTDGELKLTLKTPWLRYGATKASTFPPIYVDQERDVAPLGRAEDFDLYVEVYDMDSADYDIVEKSHYNFRKTGVANTFALVVQPASVERDQLVKMPIADVVEKIRSLLFESRDDAAQYARQVILHRAPMVLYWNTYEDIEILLKAFIEINDCQVFLEWISTVVMFYDDSNGLIRAAVEHFGWDKCVDTIVKRVLSSPSARARINLVNSLVDKKSGSVRINQLLDPLLSLFPWTDVHVAISSPHPTNDDDPPETSWYLSLIKTAAAVSHEKLIQVLTVPHPDSLIRGVIPAVKSLREHGFDSAALQPVARHLTTVLEGTLPAWRNLLYAKQKLPTHCNKCSELQAFLSSPEMRTTVTCADAAQRKHITSVFKTHLEYPAEVKVGAAGSCAVSLTKRHDEHTQELKWQREEAQTTLETLVRGQEERKRQYSWE